MRLFIFAMISILSFLRPSVEGATSNHPCFLICDHNPHSELISIDTEDLAFFKKIKEKKISAIFLSANEATKLGQDLVGLSECYFYSINSFDKQQAGIINNENIEAQILSINQYISSLGKNASNSANLISDTLTQMNIAVNNLIADSSKNAPQAIIQEDYLHIQNIINVFNEEYESTLDYKNNELTCKAINMAIISLQDFANHIENYLFQLKLMIFYSSTPNKELLSSNYQLVLSLRNFVKASAIATCLGTK